MATAYARALAWLYAHEPRGIELGLDRMREALAVHGDPHCAQPVIHVAGTNGKGSVSATVERVLRASGLRTGLYTSPHLHRFVERIRVSGKPISLAAATRGLGAQRKDTRLPPLSFFEHATLLAFDAFHAAHADVVVVEVGLGGRLDATNVVTPEVSVITHVAMDHEGYLGTTIAEVAWEKAGIIKPGVPVVTSSRGEAVDVIEVVAAERGADVFAIDRDFSVRGDDALVFEGLGTRIEGLRPTLRGAHQRDNLACAVATLVTLRARGFAIDDDAIREGVAKVRWPGRLEHIVRDDGVEILLDAAHNPNGCEALAAYVRTLPKTRTVLLFGAMKDKATDAMLTALAPVVDARVFAAPDMSRAMDSNLLAEAHEGLVAASLDAGLARAVALAGPNGRVVVAGSIFVLAHVRAVVLGLASDPPIGL